MEKSWLGYNIVLSVGNVGVVGKYSTVGREMKKNPYEAPYPEPKMAEAWDRGWCAAYDELEEEWCRKVLPIVGELEESIRYDWDNNDTLQIGKIYMIWSVFWQYPPEHDWLQPLVSNVVDLYRRDHGDKLNSREFDQLDEMARSFGIPLTKTWDVTITWHGSVEVPANDESEANELAGEKIRATYTIRDILHECEFEAEEQ